MSEQIIEQARRFIAATQAANEAEARVMRAKAESKEADTIQRSMQIDLSRNCGDNMPERTVVVDGSVVLVTAHNAEIMRNVTVAKRVQR